MKVINGTIDSFNLSPKGCYESFLLNDGTQLLQINFPHGARPEATGGLKIGEMVTVHAMPLEDDRPTSHPVYEWREQSPEFHEGVIKRINYARHGEPNGAILETGEFVHMRPEGAKAIKLKPGQNLAVKGEAKTSPAGYTVIEAREVNGVALHHPPSKAKKKHA